ncbi:fimbrial biogenesis outer membrane usher protein [Pseudohalocynthiibacter aestuariivivens]|nr:fimbria/pilus outer membrane usher protein [Pseudohalocynthiibacter aestuariivivens]QIE45811.1 fimbrial biogenesis outer membrane usher protein [Pseudohalocynthiibacter aestuariivivens]
MLQAACSAADDALLPLVTSAAYRPEFLEPEQETGAVLNYSLATELGGSLTGSGVGYNAFFGTFDGWIYWPMGTFSTTSFYCHFGSTGSSDFVRQESRYEIHNPKRALTYAVGDVTSSALSWSRSIRMGGVQVRRDFSLRGDLVTEQLLAFDGAAAVPSSVDVFIDNNRAFSTQVDSGPFRIEDVPLYHGTGEAEIVVRGRDGTESRRAVSFFASRNLIKKGMADYSFEAGFAREAYGTKSNEYGGDLVASTSLRYGLSEKITLFGHAEAKSDLAMAGFGLAAVPFSLGEVTLTFGGSKYRGVEAGFFNGTFRTSVGAFVFSVDSTRSGDGFSDLAYATGVDFLGTAQITNGSLLEFPRALDVFSVSIPVTSDHRKLGVSYVSSRRASSTDKIVSASFGQSIGSGRGSLNASASHNLSANETRLSLGLSLSLGKRRHLRTAVTRDAAGSTTVSAAVSRSMSERVSDYGYHLQVDTRDNRENLRVRGDYRSRRAEFALEAQQSEDDTYLRGQVDGALVFSGGTVTAGNTVTDSFAMVDVGIDDVPIYLQNRQVTRTGPSGRALVPGLSSFRRNRVSINVADLPDDADIGVTAMDVIPSRRAGNHVDFDGSDDTGNSVLVVLRDAAGGYIAPGSTVRVNGGGEEFVVGYDGMAYLEGVKGSNRISVDTGTSTCAAEFTHAPTGALQDVVDGVTCR